MDTKSTQAAKSAQRKPCALCVLGPFNIPLVSVVNTNAKHVAGSKALKAFWNSTVGTHGEEAAISKKDGIYIFAMRVGKGFTPWYVGLASNSFEKEVFTAGKLVKYNQVVSMHGTPVVFFVTTANQRGKNVPGPVLKRVEKRLIRAAVEKNPSLKNKRGTIDHDSYTIQGVRGMPGKPNRLQIAFRNMMGL